MQLLTGKTVIENIFSYFEIAFNMFFMCYFLNSEVHTVAHIQI